MVGFNGKASLTEDEDFFIKARNVFTRRKLLKKLKTENLLCLDFGLQKNCNLSNIQSYEAQI